MPKGYTTRMHVFRGLFVLFALMLALLQARPASAEDAGYDAAVFLLKQGTQTSPERWHTVVLPALRKLQDPALLPYFTALSNSNHHTLRAHGLLGMFELRPEAKVDLALLAEIEEESALAEVLAAAIDDRLIGVEQMAAVLKWDGLSLAIRQAVALRMLHAGGEVDIEPFRASLELELSGESPAAELLQYAIGALILAEHGDEAGKAALLKLATLRGNTPDAVISQILGSVLRSAPLHGSVSAELVSQGPDKVSQEALRAAGPLALAIAQDPSRRDTSLHLLALQTAMRLNQPDAVKAWQQSYAYAETQDDLARQVRLAMIALDSARNCPEAIFETLDNSETQWIRHISAAARAIGNNKDLPKAFAPLIADEHPVSTQWIVMYCQRDRPTQATELLKMVLDSRARDGAKTDPRLSAAAVSAVTHLCASYPEKAEPLLIDVLARTAKPGAGNPLGVRQLVLMGIHQAFASDNTKIIARIEKDEHNNFTTESLRLLLRANHGAELTEKEWMRVSDIVQGVGNLAISMRVQLAWQYLKHTGAADRAIAEALRP